MTFLKVNMLIWNIAFGIQYLKRVHDPHFAVAEKRPNDVNSAREGVNNKLLSTLITVVKVPPLPPHARYLTSAWPKMGEKKKIWAVKRVQM